MSKILRSCYNCGKKTDKLREGLCYSCFEKIHPPVEEIKPLNLKYCNSCKQIFFKNKYYEEEVFLKILRKEIKNYVVLNNNYVLKKVEIKNFIYEKGKISFDLEVYTDFKD